MAENTEIEQQREKIGELDEVLTICTLRFDAYKYWSSRYRHFGHHHDGDMSNIVDPVVNERTLYDDDCDNLTVFFCLQCYLYKWGGEHHTPWSRDTATHLTIQATSMTPGIADAGARPLVWD